MLLDVSMPRMNGFEVLKEIRRISDAPVIMLTARSEDVDQVRGLELGGCVVGIHGVGIKS